MNNVIFKKVNIACIEVAMQSNANGYDTIDVTHLDGFFGKGVIVSSKRFSGLYIHRLASIAQLYDAVMAITANDGVVIIKFF